MRRNLRLTAARDFAAVYAHARPVRSDSLILRAVQNDRDQSRFGFTTAKALGNAVVRSRLRRRLKAAISSLGIAGGWDVVINVRHSAVKLQYPDLVRQIRMLLSKAEIPVATRAAVGPA